MPEVAVPQEFGIGQAWITASKSRPGVYHFTMRTIPTDPASQPQWLCSCEGMRYAGHCWHSDTLREQFDDNDPSQGDDDIQVSLG